MPVHVPRPAVSVEPSRAVPEIVGRPVLAGGATATAVVGAEVAAAEPPSLRAVTTTRNSRPTSAPVAVYVLLVAPEIGWQLPPLASQRCHW